MGTPIPLRGAVRVGNWLIISGQLGIHDGVLVDGGVLAQTEQALANMRTILEEHGMHISDVVKTNVFLTTMDDYADMNTGYAKVFSVDPPARSAVAVRQLPLGGQVEIEAWAHKSTT